MMKFIKVIALCALFASLVGVQGCAISADKAPENQTFQGKLVLKGNDPFLVPVLIQNDGKQWALKNVSLETAMALQNKPVTVYGLAVSQPSTTRLPELAVKKIDLNR